MILKAFAIYDEKAKSYLPPFFLPEEGVAIRTFSDCVNANDHQFAAHPQDYTLFRLGTFDDSTARIDSIAPQSVHNGLELLRESQAPATLHEVKTQ